MLQLAHARVRRLQKQYDIPLLKMKSAEHWIHTPEYIAALRKVFRQNNYLTRWDVLKDKSVAKMKVMVVEAYSYCD